MMNRQKDLNLRSQQEASQSEISAEGSRGPLLNVTSSRASRRKKPYAKRLLPNETYKIYLPHNRGSDTGDTYDRFVGVFNERIFKSLQYLENVQKGRFKFILLLKSDLYYFYCNNI